MKFPIEIPLFFLLYAFMLSDPITINLIVYRTCYLTLGFDETNCSLLGTSYHDNTTAKLEELVQPHVTILTTTKSILETLFTACLCFFIGPWSDKYGRRPVLLFSLGGYTLAYVIITIISFIKTASPWYFLVSTISVCAFGGFPAFFTATICYVTDTTSPENRGFRMGLFEFVVSLSYFTGTLSSSYVFKQFGYVIVYEITTFMIFLSFITVLCFIPESVQTLETGSKLRNLFKCSLVKDTAQTTLKRRQGNDRALLLTMITIMVIFSLVTTADGGIVFLYLRRKLNWSLQLYTFYVSGRNIAWMLGTIFGSYVLHKLLHIQESHLILLGFISTCCSSIWQGIATQNWHMYVAGASKAFGGNISPMCRSLVSKIVSSEDAGRVFSFIIIVETFVNLIGSPSYTFIYNRTIASFPGLFNFVSAGIYLNEILLIIPVIIMQKYRNTANYENIIEEGTDDNDSIPIDYS